MIAETYLPEYGPQGFQPVIVHVGDQLGFGCELSKDFGAYMPLLLDSDDTLLNIFQQVGPESVLFPLAFLVDRESVVAHVYNDPDAENGETKSPASLLDDLAALLAL